MNWSLIGWIVGGLVTIYAIRFLFDLFKNLFGKDQREYMIYKIGCGVHNASESMTDSLKKKAAERKQKKEEERKAMVWIR